MASPKKQGIILLFVFVFGVLFLTGYFYRFIDLFFRDQNIINGTIAVFFGVAIVALIYQRDVIKKIKSSRDYHSTRAMNYQNKDFDYQKQILDLRSHISTLRSKLKKKK